MSYIKGTMQPAVISVFHVLLVLGYFIISCSCQINQQAISQSSAPSIASFITSVVARNAKLVARVPSTITINERTTLTTTIPGETNPTTLETSTSISLTDSSAIVSYIQTAIPSEVRTESSYGCFVNSEFSYYATPTWYASLPTEVQSYYSSVNQGNTAACTLASNDPAATSGASATSASASNGSGSGLSTGAKVGIALGAVGAAAAIASALWTIFKGNPCGHSPSKAAPEVSDAPPKHSTPSSGVPQSTGPTSNIPAPHQAPTGTGMGPSSPGPSSPPPGYVTQPHMSQIPQWDGHAGSQPPTWDGQAGSQAPPAWNGSAGSQAPPGWNGNAGSQAPPGWDGSAGSQAPPGWNGNAGNQVPTTWDGTAGSQAQPGWNGWAGSEAGPNQSYPSGQGNPTFNGEAGSAGQPNTGLGSQPQQGWSGWAGSDAAPSQGFNGGSSDANFTGEAGSGDPNNTGLGSQPPPNWSGSAGGEGNWTGAAGTGNTSVIPPTAPGTGTSDGQIPIVPLFGAAYRRDKKEPQQRVSSYHSDHSGQGGFHSPAYMTPSERPTNELSGVSSNTPWAGYSNESVRAEMPGDSPYFHQRVPCGQIPMPGPHRRSQSDQNIARRPVGSRSSTGGQVSRVTGSPQPPSTPRGDPRATYRQGSYEMSIQQIQYLPQRGVSPVYESGSRTIYESGARTVHESDNADIYESGSQTVSRSDGSARR